MTELQPFENSEFGSLCNSFYFVAANWANSKFSNGYNSVILKAIIMTFLPRVQNCGGSLKMSKKSKTLFWEHF